MIKRACVYPGCGKPLSIEQRFSCCRPHRVTTPQTRKRLCKSRKGHKPNLGKRLSTVWRRNISEGYKEAHPVLTSPEWIHKHPEAAIPTGRTREIETTSGIKVLVDEELFDFLSQFSWSAQRVKYHWQISTFNRHQKFGSPKRILMHRMILGVPDSQEGDHRNRNTLDYRRANLRPATHEQNQRNRCANRNNKTGFKGVAPKRKKFCAQIHLGPKKIHLGTFASPTEAAHAYDAAALRLYRDFAFTNFTS